MFKLVLELPFVNRNRGRAPGNDPATIKPVVPSIGFIRDPRQICANSFDWLRRLSKTPQLRMMLIPLGHPSQHFLRQQPLAPHGHQSHAIQQRRV